MTEIDFWFSIGSTYKFLSVNRISEVAKRENIKFNWKPFSVRKIKNEEIIINPDYAYPAYGVPSDETNDAIRLAAKTEGLITDPVYEGKSMQGLIDLAKKNYFPEGSKILYAHLGGAPALNGYSYYYKDG